MQQIALFILGGSEEDGDGETKSRGTRFSDSEEEGDVIVRASKSNPDAETEDLFPDEPPPPNVKIILRELSALSKLIQDHANSFYHEKLVDGPSLLKPRSRVAGVRFYVANRVVKYLEADDGDYGKTHVPSSILCC